MSAVDEDLFGRRNVKVKKTRKEKREEKRMREQLLVVTEKEKEEEKVETSDLQESVDKALESSPKLGGDSIVRHELDVSAENLRTWQAEDNTLKDIWEAVRKCEAKKGIGFSLTMACSFDGGFLKVGEGKEVKKWLWSNW